MQTISKIEIRIVAGMFGNENNWFVDQLRHKIVRFNIDGNLHPRRIICVIKYYARYVLEFFAPKKLQVQRQQLVKIFISAYVQGLDTEQLKNWEKIKNI